MLLFILPFAVAGMLSIVRWHHTKVVSFDLNVLLTLCLLSHHAACITGESNGCLDRRAWLRSPRALVLMVSLPADCFLIDALVYHAAIACSILFCALTFTGLVALDRAPLRQGLLETPVFIVCLLVVSLLYCQIMSVHWFVAPRSYSHVSCIDKCIDLRFHSRAPSEEPLLPRRSARHGADWTSSSLVLSPRWVWSSLPVFDLRLREVPSSRSTSKVMILVHVLVRVHRDSCVVRIISSIVPRVYKHDILMRRTGLVVFPFGCGLSCWVASGVFCGLSGPRPAAAAGTGCAAAALANWHSLVWRLGDAAAPPAPLPDDRPAIPPAQLPILSMPRPELLYAVPICTGTGAWCPGRPCGGPSPRRQRGMSAAAEADGNSGLLASNRTAPGAGTSRSPCPCRRVASLHGACL